MSKKEEKLYPILMSLGGDTKWCKDMDKTNYHGINFVPVEVSNIIWVTKEGLEDIQNGFEPDHNNIQKCDNTYHFLTNLDKNWNNIHSPKTDN